MSETQPSRAGQVANAFIGIVIVVWLGFIGAHWAWENFGPHPSPVDPVDPDEPDDDDSGLADIIKITQDDAADFAKMVRQSHREAKRESSPTSYIRQVMPDRIFASFPNLGEKFQGADDHQFADVIDSAATGLVHASDVLKRMRKDDCDDHVSRYFSELAPNFRDAANSLRKLLTVEERANSEQHIHDELVRRNHVASTRLISGLCKTFGERAFSGYLIDDEHREELRQTSSNLPLLMQWAESAPKDIDPRGWHRIENQGPMGSCQGHALSSVCENAYLISTGGRSKKVIQFSPYFAYLDSQKMDQIFGRGDIGSTLAGGLASAMRSGSCPLEKMPYPNPVRYTGEFAPGAYDAAKNFKIRQHTWLKNYDEVYGYLASGLGGVEIGIRWGNGMMECHDGVIEHHDSRGGGGHAVCFLGYTSEKTDSRGRKYLRLANSWGTEWGDEGWALVSPVAVDEMCRHPETVMLGLSDMSKKDTHRRDVSWMGPGSVFGQQPKANKASKQLAI